MEISLIENGLDSISKAYKYLREYEEILASASATNKQRYFLLKDSILSIQHGIEILFKYILIQENEVLLFSSIDEKLLKAYIKRRSGDIKELYDHDNVHTVTFKEAINRARDICGKEISDDFKKRLLKVEEWRNKITHSSVTLPEQQVSKEIRNIFIGIDDFFTKSIGEDYINSQEKENLDREYRLYSALHARHENDLKLKVIKFLNETFQANGISSPKTNSCIRVSSFDTAMNIMVGLQEIQYFGADFTNGHCSGKARLSIHNKKEKIIKIDATADNNTDYFLKFSELILYIPRVESVYSPMIFIYSDNLGKVGSNPDLYTDSDAGCTTQMGLLNKSNDEEIWDKSKKNQIIYNNDYGDTGYTPVVHLVRFLSSGLTCFLNIQHLEYYSFNRILGEIKYNDIEKLEQDLKSFFDKNHHS